MGVEKVREDPVAGVGIETEALALRVARDMAVEAGEVRDAIGAKPEHFKEWVYCNVKTNTKDLH